MPIANLVNLAVLGAAVAVGVVLFIAGVRFVAQGIGEWVWRRSLIALELQLPVGCVVEDVAAWLATVHAATSRTWAGGHPSPLVLEITATAAGITHTILVQHKRQATIVAGLQTSLPGISVTEAPKRLTVRPAVTRCVELASAGRRPLAIDRAATTSTAFLAALQPLHGGEQIRVQWILTGAPTPPVIRTPRQQTNGQQLPWWVEDQAPADVDDVRALRAKHKELLLHAVVRIGALAPSRARARALIGRTAGPLGMMNAPGAHLRRRWSKPSRVAGAHLRAATLPVGHWPLLLNTHEAAGLVGIPIGQLHLPGLPAGTCRQLPPPPAMRGDSGAIVATSNYPGQPRDLTLQAEDRLRHTWALGPPGSGKSTLLANIASRDIAHGDGLVLVDAKGDLIADVLDRVPSHRVDDVIVIDPTQGDHVVGINPLTTGSPEQAAGFTYHVLHSIYAQSWGPRTADILRAGLLTLTSVRAANGEAFTLMEIPELLTNPGFRHVVTTQPGVSAQVQRFWRWFDTLSETHQASICAPLLNKLRTFTLSATLRATLGQSAGIDLSEVLAIKRIVLVALKKGLLGQEVSGLIGSLVISTAWQAAMARANLPKHQRHPFWLIVDEFQDVMKLPLDVVDMLAQARGLGVGVILAHQYMNQLDTHMQAAVIGATRTQIAFQLGSADAHQLATHFKPLTSDDLHNLAVYDIAMRPCVGGITLPPVTGTTHPMPTPTTDGAALAQTSQQRHGLPVSEVDEQITQRIKPPTKVGAARFGRIPIGGGQP